MLRNRPKWFAPAIVGGGILLVVIFGVAARHGPAAVDITTVIVKPSQLVNKLPENGTLSLPETATIAARTSATIVHITAREGAKVRLGDLLLKLDDREVAAKVSADEAALAQSQSALRKAQATAATAGDTNVQNVALADQNMLAAQAQLQSDLSAKRTGQVSASGFSSLGMSGESQLAQQRQLLVDTTTNLKTAKDQYEGDKQLYAMNALSLQQMNRDQAAYQQAVAAQESAQRQYDLTVQQLHDSAGQLGSKIESDRQAVASATAALSAARIQASQNAAVLDEKSQEASVASAQAQLDYDREQLADTEVRAPFDGIIQTIGTVTSPLGGTTALAVGDQVTLGQSLFTIAGNGPMVVKAQVDEQDVINVKMGQHAFITGEDFPGYSLIGTVIRVAPVVVAQNQAGNAAKNVETTVALNKSYPFLRDGMSCDVDIVTGKVRDALIVPQSAIVDDHGKHYLYIVKDRKVKKTLVAEGLKNDTDVVIKKGVAAGDVVATTNISDLKDGAPVNPTPSESPSPSNT